MIATLRGTLIAVSGDHLIVETGGVGFLVYAPRPVLASLGAEGEEVRLHTHLLVREDALTLFGFSTRQQLALFETLLSVSGVGPRVALNLLGGLQPDELRAAVAGNDIARLSKVPGIGKKTAERLVLELRGKLDLKGLPAAAATTTLQATGVNTELAELLMSLGYSAAEATAAVGSLPADAPPALDDRLRLALRYFGGP
jgi:Holliday junction DNA helicase RuvA